jgi:hypothetical protein
MSPFTTVFAGERFRRFLLHGAVNLSVPNDDDLFAEREESG